MAYGSDSYKINLGLPAQPADTIPPDLYEYFNTLHKAIHNLLRGVSQYAGVDPPASDTWDSLTYQDTILTGNATRMYPIAGATIARGALVNLYNDAGTLKARLAVNTSASTMAHGIANTAAVAGQRLEINWLRGVIDSIGSLTVGSLYYLSPVAGFVQATRPATAGQIIQPIGLAVGTSTMIADTPLYYQQL